MCGKFDGRKIKCEYEIMKVLVILVGIGILYRRKEIFNGDDHSIII